MSRPLAAALLLALAGAAAPVTAPSCGDSYRVVRGDTLSRIARRCGSSVVAIARASGVRNPNLILVGQRLVIPGAAPTAVAERRTTGARSLVYRMARGDTLYSLARWSRSGLPALLAANPGIDPHKIEIGDAVRLPAGAVRPERARARERGSVAPPDATPRAAEPAAPADPPPARQRDREADTVAM
jgi:LysM repeat protein